MRAARLAAAALALTVLPLAAQDVRGHLQAGDAARCRRNADEALGHYRAALAYDSMSYDEAVAMCCRAAEDGITDLLVAGGDGTVNLALNAIAGTPVRLGVIPCGTANDLAGRPFCTQWMAR